MTDIKAISGDEDQHIDLKSRSNMRKLGDRMKSYEEDFTIKNELPFIARIDGHKFSSFTRGFQKPWDKMLEQAMIRTTTDLVTEFKAVTGYTQSDEISLIFMPKYDQKTGVYRDYPFNGRPLKIASLLAGFTSSRFNYHLQNIYKGINNNKISDPNSVYSGKTIEKILSGSAYFDARVFSLPTNMEIFNYIYWRSSHDCVRNSISNLARNNFSNKELHKKHSGEMIEMLKSIGIDYETQPSTFKYGTFVKREKFLGTGFNPKTEAIINDVIRTRIRLFNTHITEFSDKILALLIAKYFNIYDDIKVEIISNE